MRPDASRPDSDSDRLHVPAPAPRANRSALVWAIGFLLLVGLIWLMTPSGPYGPGADGAGAVSDSLPAPPVPR
jgi:hypothetical protein